MDINRVELRQAEASSPEPRPGSRGGEATLPGEPLPGTLCGTSQILLIRLGLNRQGLSKHRPELFQLWACKSFGQRKPVLTQRRQSPPAPLPHGHTSGQLQSEPDWGTELG